MFRGSKPCKKGTYIKKKTHKAGIKWQLKDNFLQFSIKTCCEYSLESHRLQPSLVAYVISTIISCAGTNQDFFDLNSFTIEANCFIASINPSPVFAEAFWTYHCLLSRFVKSSSLTICRAVRASEKYEKLLVGWLCWGLTSQSTIFQSCRDGAIASWVINQYFRGVKCLAQGHNTAAVGFEPRTSRSGVRHSTTEPPRSRWKTVSRFVFRYQFVQSRSI